jgi:branched-subunit amino acid ABC-type transport system permease component
MGEVLFDTLITGSELALIAVGMTLVFGAVKFANIAQVEFATLGAYGTVLAGSLLGGGPLFVHAVLSIIGVGLIAVGLYHLIFKRLLSRSPATAMIGSLALSILLRALIQTITGPRPKELDLPLERGEDILGALVTPSQLRIVVISAIALAGLMALLRLTPLGRSIRAVSANPDLAAAAGINVRRVIDVVWLIAGVFGALGGVMLAIDNQVSLEMGFSLLLPVFAIALLGGFGSPGGAILASYILAFAESVVLRVDWGELLNTGSAYLDSSYRPAIGFVLLLLVLLIRPQGIFGREARRA